MAYCSYCAAVLDPGQPMCARCGNASAVAAAPSTIPASARPASVSLAVVLLLITVGISIVTLVGFLLVRGATGVLAISFLPRSLALLILWIALIVCIWLGQGWARFGIALLLLWGVGNLLFSFLRFSGVVGFTLSMATPLLIDALRAVALYMLFTTKSNSWFKTR